MAKSPWRYIKGNPMDLIKELQRYNDDVIKEMDKLQKKLSKKAHRRLKEESPRSNKDERHYADSWRVKREYEKGGAKQFLIIHNKGKPTLTHLLENGHINAKTGKRVKAQKHIAPIQEEINNEWEEGLAKILEDN